MSGSAADDSARLRVRDRACAVADILENLYPDPRPLLAFRNAFELMIATILSAQCTDERRSAERDGIKRNPVHERLL